MTTPDPRTRWRDAYRAARAQAFGSDIRSPRRRAGAIAAHLARVPQVLAWTNAERMERENAAAAHTYTTAAAAYALEPFRRARAPHLPAWATLPAPGGAASLLAGAQDSGSRGLRRLAARACARPRPGAGADSPRPVAFLAFSTAW